MNTASVSGLANIWGAVNRPPRLCSKVSHMHAYSVPASPFDVQLRGSVNANQHRLRSFNR
jgi:hypothetical protein